MLVAFACLFSLLILAILCGVYFSNNLTDLRAERLEVISQLKTSQVTQAIDYLFYQVYWLTTRDTITEPLTSYRAGNNSNAVFDLAQSTLDQFLTSSESFAAARLYNLDLAIMAESFNNATSVSAPAMDFLYPLQQNLSVPNSINELGNKINSYYFTGPVSNNSDPDSAYFIGITYPVFANTSIILNAPSMAGYLSVITSANNIQQAVNNSSPMASQTENADKYSVIAVEPVFEDGPSDPSDLNDENLIGFQAVFPVPNSELESNRVYNINASSAMKEALTLNFGSSTNKKDINGKSVAIGYSRIDLDDTIFWSIIIEQSLSDFNAPVDKFTRIIIGVSFGIGAFVCLITFPLTVLFIRPITKLKDATEAITRSKREKERGLDVMSDTIDSVNSGSPPPPYYSTLIRRMHRKKSDTSKDEENDDETGNKVKFNEKSVVKANKRNSVLSAGTGGSTSVYSTGIRLPSHIPHSKKFFKDELTELTEAFNIMREELERQYVHLEDRVKSRTKELEASKVEAEAANEAKTVFIANISHELRTPLNGILGMTSIAMEEHDQLRIKDSLKLINRSGELLLHILTELLTYSKNTLNRSKLEKSSFQILEIVYQIQSIFGKLANDQRVFFKILLKPNTLRKLILYGDSNRIIQVVMNLVSNSLKFTPVDGRVDVNFKLLGEYDHERSKLDGYNSVFVTHHDGPTSSNNPKPAHTTPTNPQSNGKGNNPYDGGAPKEPKDSVPVQDEPVQDPPVQDGPAAAPEAESIKSFPDNDTTSIATLSTAEYNNVVFHSQFNQNSKPLPNIPDNSPPSHSNTSGNDTTETDATETGTDPHDTSKVQSVPVSPAQPAVPDKQEPTLESSAKASASGEKLLPPPNMRDTVNGTISTTSGSKRPSIGSTSSSLNSNELVKDDKVFKIKNLYKPKTWVLQIEVKDTGSGIEPALQEKVFEPFIQGDQTLSRSYGGTGLGLSICRQLARMMKGTMTLKSTLGVGSTFIFTVPLPQVGEILVPDEDMPEFSEDEFNPKSKINRKVAFTFGKDDIINESSEDMDPHTVDHSNTMSSFNTSGEGTSANGTSGGDTSGSANGTNGSGGIDFKIVPPTEPLSTSSPKDTLKVPSRPGSLRKSSDDGSDNSRKKFEKPHLITRGSTGTANSSSGSDKLDTSHYLLEDLSHLKILVAEDNMVNQEVIKRMLLLEGFTNITMASNGAEAVDHVQESIAKEDMFDLVFMDVQMPKVDGLLATKMIRSNLQYDKPIIALTAFADESNAKECLSSGMSGFLAKPIRRTNLRKIITEFSPILLNDVTTPQTHQSDDKRLGYSQEASD